MPPYTDREGGTVCNIAITRYATASVSIGGHHSTDAAPPLDDALIAAAIRRSPLPNAVATVTSDFPIGAGLGGSSAAGVALAGALARLADTPLSPHNLALMSRTTEVEELGVAGGYQDHFAAAFGGALLLEFSHTVRVQSIPLETATCDTLARRGLLIYTGESRISGEQITAVRDAYVAGVPRVVQALARMKALAIDMASALRANDLDALGAQLEEHWIHQRALHPSITTPRIEAINDTAHRNGALGMKALGASGGGCVLALAREGREDELAAALAPLGTRLTYGIDTTGFETIPTLGEATTQ